MLKHNVFRTEFYILLQVERTHFGPVDMASLCLWRQGVAYLLGLPDYVQEIRELLATSTGNKRVF
jgi:hypothetical protein